jgi:glycosyltransferase involved in cell wall biosynthesis
MSAVRFVPPSCIAEDRGLKHAPTVPGPTTDGPLSGVRILLVGDYPPDPRLGSTKVLIKLQEEFRALGHTCDLLLSDGIGAVPHNPYLRQAFGPVAAWSAVRRMVKTHGPYDVVDVASAEGLWIGSSLGRRMLGGAVVISRSNGLEHLNYRRLLDDAAAGLASKPWTRRLFHPAVRLTQVAAAARTADRLLLLNDGDRAFALERGWKSEADIDVVPHGVSGRFLADAPSGREVRGRGILFCGSWTAVKGVAYLADAFSRLVESGRVTNLTILGGAMPEDDIRSAFAPEARRFLTILDRAPEDEVMAAYRVHDVLAWPSTYEGFGMVVVEAMSQRLPVVATPVGCARSLIVPGCTGLLVPPRDPAALAAALERMLTDGDLRARCSAAAFDLVRGMTWMRTAEHTLDVYRRALAGRSDGR